jgi:tape measure domain-containing protein
MANVATLTAKMVMDVSGFLSGANKVGSSLKGIKGDVDSASSGFGKMFGAVTAGSLASAAAIKTLSLATRGIGLALNEIGRGFKLAAAAETAESGFKVMLGSAEKAKAMMKDLAAFTLATPFSTEGTHDVANTLLGVGVDDQKLVGTMTTLGNIASGNTEKLKGLAVVYGQVQSKGKLLAQDFNQIAERGINMRQVLANEVGVSVKDLAKTMEAGKITFEDFHNALVELSKTKYKGMLDEKNKTMQGAIDRIGEVRDSFARDVAMGVGKHFGATATAGDLANFAEGLSAKVLPEFVGGLIAATDSLFTFADNMRGLAMFLNPAAGVNMSDVRKKRSGMRGMYFPEYEMKPGTSFFEQLGKIDTRRDFRKYLEDVKAAGAEAIKNKANLPGPSRIQGQTWEELFKGAAWIGGKMVGRDGFEMPSEFRNIGNRVGNAFGRVRDRFAIDGKGQERQPTGALVAGSSEAFSAIIRSMFGKDNAKAELAELKSIKAAVEKTGKSVVDAIEKQITGVLGMLPG